MLIMWSTNIQDSLGTLLANFNKNTGFTEARLSIPRAGKSKKQ